MCYFLGDSPYAAIFVIFMTKYAATPRAGASPRNAPSAHNEP